ncbi:hypothetical protein Cs7R123_13850 [Catellatospora sp. TT07R-123]|uniref:hypothetical protein n=1 Tax=Catellatospora sp. TT07R-123 TaxID=2733863 RepID=UPI001B0DCC49|nr:hypothetical protein [Catellatospora sp. TT07R-123]GHJ44043.1 hypothetical protein Cs7R123_13850 [Catellatospora sp. TT07R-123]
MITSSPWSAAEALAYAHAGGPRPYDEIGSRLRSAAPQTGAVPLRTITDLRRERDARTRSRLPARLQGLLDHADRLAHRPIDLPTVAGRMGWQVRGDVIHLSVQPEGQPPQLWSFPLTTPPTLLREQATDDDVPAGPNQTHRIDLPGVRWLPLPTLAATGRILRMQDWRDQLVGGVHPGRLYLFVSHRWLTPDEPDPDGTQAGVLAWHLLAAACEAVRVAHLRGLRKPRRRSTILGLPIGMAGSELAEAIIVNVLRPLLDDDALAVLYAEAGALDALTADHGLTAALADPGLSRLRELLGASQLLRSVLDRIMLWYDYACLPQRPHADAQEAHAFEQGLRELGAYQLIGRTVVMLDDVDAHLASAWCTLEALVADANHTSMHLMPGGPQPAEAAEQAERFLREALADRPHLVWRALLDTEVFALQDPVTCMARLGLTTTRPGDLPLVYRHLLTLGAPPGVHVDDSEVVTGVLALPVAGADVVVPVDTGRGLGPVPPGVGGLDATAALRLLGGPVPDPGHRPPWQQWAGGAHAVVVAGCEAEAVLIAAWVRTHLDEIAAAAGGPVGSLSWLASDIAPVGHLPQASLRTAAVAADRWLLLTTSARLRHCVTTAAVRTAVAAAGLSLLHIALDQRGGNLSLLPPGDPADRRVRRVPAEQVRHADVPGGVFRAGLTQLTLAVAGGDR